MTHDWAGAQNVPATYRWSFDGLGLSFIVVGQDVIASRLNTMNALYVPAD